MNDNFQTKDERLSRVLKTWKIDAPLPPHFQDQVWQRIARADRMGEATLWTVFQGWLVAALSRRAVAVAYLAVLLATGLTAGYWSGQQKSRHVATSLSERYLQSVDPYQASGNK
jgi:hypothetical protein